VVGLISTDKFDDAEKVIDQAEEKLNQAIAEKGRDCAVEFPNTGYYFPIIYSMTGRAVEKLADFEEVMKDFGKGGMGLKDLPNDFIKCLRPPLTVQRQRSHFLSILPKIQWH